MYIAGNKIKVGPETISEGKIAYQLKNAYDYDDIWDIKKGDIYLQAVYGNTMYEEKEKLRSIGPDGRANLSVGRYLLHPAEKGNNSGCGVTNKTNFIKYTKQLNSIWNIPVGAVIFGNIHQKYDPLLKVYKRR